MRDYKLTTASTIAPRLQKWLVRDQIPLGTITTFAGDGGSYKTTAALYYISKLSRGQLDGHVTEPADTLIISTEDAWAQVMVPRLMAAGADLDRVHRFEMEELDQYEGGVITTRLKLPLDLQRLRAAIVENNVRCVVFDPADDFVGDGDGNKPADVRRAFSPILGLAQDTQIAAILLRHFKKGGSTLGSKMSGAHSWRDISRAYWAFAVDRDEGEEHIVMTNDKSNYGKAGDSLELSVHLVPLVIEGESVEFPAITGMHATERSVTEIINRETPQAEEKAERQSAEDWLLAFLDREPYEFPAPEIKKAAAAQMISTRTLYRAKKDAGVGDYATKTFPASSVWTHPRLGETGGTPGTTGEKTSVSAGQNSYATGVPTVSTWHTSGTAGVTRENTQETPSCATPAALSPDIGTTDLDAFDRAAEAIWNGDRK